MLCPPAMGGKVPSEGESWPFSEADLWRAAPALARQARRCRLAPFGGSPARRCLSEPLDTAQLSQFVKEEHAACRAADRRRYNFDFETMQPLEGRFCWQRVGPPAEDDDSASSVRRSASLGAELSPAPALGAELTPAPALVRPAPELARRSSVGAAWDEDRRPDPAVDRTAAGDALCSDMLRSGKRPSAFSRCDDRRTKQIALSEAELAPMTSDSPEEMLLTEERSPDI